VKKTSINILCILIILTIGASIMAPAFKLSSIFISGFMAGWQQASTSNEASGSMNSIEDSLPLDVAFMPDASTVMHGKDCITFEDGNSYPVIYDRVALLVPDKEIPIYLSLTPTLLNLACFVLFIFLAIEFIRFIVNINKGLVFDIKNVKRLKRFSYYLISIAILRCAAGIIDDMTLSSFGLNLQGYSLSASWSFPWVSLILGLLALLMARIWERGIEMKEEQELTI